MKLREIRVRKVLTQKDLSERSGVAAVTIAAIERGIQLPSLRTSRKLAEALDVEPTVIDEVNKQIWDIVVDLQQNLVNKSTINQEEENVEVGAKRNVNKATNNTKNISRREESTHKLISMSCLRRD